MSDDGARRVVVYVEGKSDQQGLASLLAPLIERCAASGTKIDFVPLEGKSRVMLTTPERAVNILRNDPSAEVVALPDLYPPNEGGQHRTAVELTDLLIGTFRAALKRKVGDDERIASRFHVHCSKHDLEALVLAAPHALAARLGLQALPVEWTIPVEDHNHGDPPKRVIERLFARYGQLYQAAIDAPLILGKADYKSVVEACQQCFRPFVELLEGFCSA